jgi:hypothetical protein
MAPSEKTIAYRIPPSPVGNSYYRKGTLYEAGSVVRLPADEVPPGWTRREDGTLCSFKKNPKTGKIMEGKRHPHAWIEETPGLAQSLEARDARQAARDELADLEAQLAEKQRLLEELEEREGTADEGDEKPEGEGDDAGAPADAEAAGDAEAAPKKGKGRRRAADQDV